MAALLNIQFFVVLEVILVLEEGKKLFNVFLSVNTDGYTARIGYCENNRLHVCLVFLLWVASRRRCVLPFWVFL